MAKHVYENGVTEWFIAESAEAAGEDCRKMNMANGFADASGMDLEFHQVPDDKVLTMTFERAHAGGGGSEDEVVKMTAGEFAAQYPIGFLGTTEF